MAFSAAVPTLIRDWVARYHEQAEANGVAVSCTTGRELWTLQLTIIISS